MSQILRRNTWNWLPVFLEVADAGSLVAAAARLHLTPAAVSRTLRLLEEELGHPLFNRVGRGLVLNTSGAALQGHVRTAVTTVEQGLSDLKGDPLAGPLRVASLGVLTEHFVVPALIALKKTAPALLPEHINLRASEANTELARGKLDLAFYYEELTAEGVLVERLGETSMSVYCGKGHVLFRQSRVTQKNVLEHPFSVPQIGDSGRVMDGWPADLPRLVGMRITMLQSNLSVCLSGTLLTVLPDVVAAVHVRQKELRRLPVHGLPAIEVFAARPAAALHRSALQVVVDGVRTRLTEENRAVRRVLGRRSTGR